MSSTGLSVGVVGCGYWGSKHVRVLHSLEGVDRVAAIDSSSEGIAVLQRAFPAVDGYPSLEAALDHIDAVVIATPPTSHCGLAIEATAAGKHVLVEKPMATSADGARLLIEAARAQGVILMVGHTFEYHAAVWKLRELVRSGELGRLHYLDTARLNLGRYQNDVNVLFDLASHDVSILNYVLGSRPVSVECWASRNAHRQLEDVAYMRLYYDNPGVYANVHVSWLDPLKVRRVTAVGGSKMVVFDDLVTEERIRIHDKGVTELSREEGDLTQPPMTYRYGDVVSPYLTLNEPLGVQDQHFVDCIQSQTYTPWTDGDNGLAVVQVLECAQRAFKQGRAVEIEEGLRELQPVGSGQDYTE
jgi:predicted dehydrogenase